MATTRAVFTPFSAELAVVSPQITVINLRPVLGFSDTVQQTAMWTSVAPQGLSGNLIVVITYMMASATTGLVDFEVALEAITDGDATDLDAGDSFDSVNSESATVPGTAGQIDQLSVTLTNVDSIVVGDYFRLQVARDADDATNDTATGECYVLTVELRDQV